MGRLLWLEPVGGISGDMALAALLDLGAPRDAIDAGLARLGLPGWELVVSRASKAGIHGTRVDVKLAGDDASERSFAEIRALLAGAGLPKGARELALRIFEALARAEAHVHATTVDQVHFHEVGA